MSKTILITGSTDGIGLETAKRLAGEGHHIIIHGRDLDKLASAVEAVGGTTSSYIADFSNIADVQALAAKLARDHQHLDVLINNAGVLKTPSPVTQDGLDIRFVVNTIAPYVLTQRLLPLMDGAGRIVNLSSAAQSAVNLAALRGEIRLDDLEAYAQSKLAITIWSSDMARRLPKGPVVLAVNPGSLLASKMVKDGFGVVGSDLSIGADVLRNAALDAEFAEVSGRYFDNDIGQFAPPHADAFDEVKVKSVVQTVHEIASDLSAQ